MRLHKGEKPFACEKCPLSFTQFVHLKLHKRLHNNERPFICGTCGKSYISASGLRTHWKTTKCEPTPAEEAITAERSLFLLQQNDQNFLNFNHQQCGGVGGGQLYKYENGRKQSNQSSSGLNILIPDSDSAPLGSPAVSESGSLVMDMEEGEKRFSGGLEDHDMALSDPEGQERPGRSYTVTSLPASEHAELANAVLSSSGPKINCPGPASAPADISSLSSHCDWPADHTAIC